MLTIYQASAGSGKTYTLAKRYISLLLSQRQPNAHRGILAVTFTHKATNEMKNRIVRELHALASGMPSAYREGLMQENNCDAEEINRRAGKALTDILQDYSGFAIGTIDSFFQQVTRSFAREIGLPGSYNVCLDTNDLVAQGIDRMFFELGEARNKPLLRWLTRFAENIISEGRAWKDLQKEMEEFGREIFKENYQNKLADTAKQMHDKPFLANYLDTLRGIRNLFEQRVRQIAEEALQLIASRGLQTVSFNRKSTGPMTMFDKWAAGDMVPPSDPFRTYTGNVESCYTKSDPPAVRDAIISLHAEGLGQRMQQMVDLFDKDYPAYQTADTILANLYTLGIMSDLSAYIRKITEEQNIMPLANTSLLLHHIIDGSDTPFIYEKIGTRIRHYMIDEFQDTSAMQWKNFHPLIANSVAMNQENLVVGDVKQSIYRWRNSDWRLLDEIVPNDSALAPRSEVLGTNWRSNRDIVEFNNELFQQLPQLMQTDLEGSYATRFMHAYENLKQEPHRQENGYVRIRFVQETDNAPKWKEMAMDDMLDRIQDAQNRGIALHEMAILARTGKDVQRVTQFLIGKGVPIISSEGLLLPNAPAVRFLMAVLCYMADPADIIHRTIVNFEYACNVGKLSNDDALAAATLADGLLCPPEEWASIVETDHASLFDIVQQIINVFRVYEWPNAAIFVQAFSDYVFDYTAIHPSDIRNFIDYWDKNASKVTIAMPEAHNAIQAMTIHKAKGLEFKCVFVPFCDWRIENNHHRNTLWCQPSCEPFNRLELVPVNYNKSLGGTIFADDYQEEYMQARIDSLNLLYVAFTRPKQELHACCLAPNNTKTPSNNTMSNLLWKCLLDDLDEQQIYQRGQLLEAAPRDGQAVPADDLSAMLNKHPHGGAGRVAKLQVKSPARDSDEALSEENRLDLGVVMHEILCNIILKSDQETAIENMVLSGRISRNDVPMVREQLDKFWQMEGVEEWFGGEYRVLTEAEILTPEGTVYRPDRLMLRGDEAIVADYKFGAAQHPRYQRQVRNYMNLVRQMGYRVRGYLCYIEQNERIEVPAMPAES